MKNKAVFLDRDGTLINNPNDEPPRTPEEVVFFPGVIDALQKLSNAGYLLFVVSNQPDYAKGKDTLENMFRVHVAFDYILKECGVFIKEYYYCYHKAEDNCVCRKPKSYFLLKSAEQYNISLKDSWMVGDRDTDIECGRRAGTKTTKVITECLQ